MVLAGWLDGWMVHPEFNGFSSPKTELLLLKYLEKRNKESHTHTKPRTQLAFEMRNEMCVCVYAVVR